MAVYKVPQDVEADDKLIGPFSFRQFIYLIIVVGGIALGWALAQVFVGLAIIPLPIIIFFGALALPLRKDQPMETYLAAVVSFYIKPRKRLWDPDGQQALVEITAPHQVETIRTKGLSETEAEQRLSYLADVVDSRGWAVRGVSSAPEQINQTMNPNVYQEAQQAEDILDSANATYSDIDSRLDKADERHHQELVKRLQNPDLLVTQIEPQQDEEPRLTFNPYPSSIHQAVLQPLSEKATQKNTVSQNEQTISTNQPSPDIINLANSSYSIETIAHEASRIKQRESLPKDEVVISLH